MMIHFILLFGSIVWGVDRSFDARVVGVKDGDTIEVVTEENVRIIVRLEHVDCPEKKQAYGQKAKKYVSEYCYDKVVTIVTDGTVDRNGRMIARVYIGALCLNEDLVRHGMAWHFKKYSKSPLYANLEEDAHRQKLGLWADENAIAPWVFRKKTKEEKFQFLDLSP